MTLADIIHLYMQSLSACLHEQYQTIILSYNGCKFSASSLCVHFKINEGFIVYPIGDKFDLTDLQELLSALFCLPRQQVRFFVDVEPRRLINYYSNTVIAYNVLF